MPAARLPNPHIVPVYEFALRGDLAYLVMPLVEGVSLADRIAEGRLPLRPNGGSWQLTGSILAPRAGARLSNTGLAAP